LGVKLNFRAVVYTKSVCLSVALLLAAGTGWAQSADTSDGGSFTLPLEVHWGNAVLRAGDYSFAITRFGESTRLLEIRGNGVSARMLSVPDISDADGSRLTVVTMGEKSFIEELKLPGLTFRFAIPRNSKIAGRFPRSQTPWVGQVH
jgi:hypothetical protein